MTTLAAGTAARPSPPPAPSSAARAGMALWRLFCSVDFAVLQIIVLALLAVVGMTVRQLPGYAFRSATDYAVQMTALRVQYEPVLGPGLVDLLERLQLFHVFTSTWFTLALVLLAVSIVICTLDRTPRLWHQSAEQRVVQPDAYFDPRLPQRAVVAGGGDLDADGVAAVLRRHRFTVTRVGAFVYGDRNRWVKMATLISHLGLILFLVAGAVTARLGDEQGLVVAEGDTLTVQPIGTPGLLLVKNLGFAAPGLATGNPTDFTTDLAVYRDGVQVARKTIRVNDPLTVDDYTFHQNGFGPALDLVLRDTTDGAVLWSGPVALTDSDGGLPFGTMPVPGTGVGLQLLLSRTADGVGTVVVLPYAVNGTNADGTPHVVNGFPLAIVAGETQAITGLDTSIELRGFSEYTLLIAKRDPGAPIVWGAFAALITGLVITFYLPRRRVWTRVEPGGRVSLVGRSDRTVDFDREFGRVLADLVAARGPAPVSDPPPEPPTIHGADPA
jgi:cytochrome c biogenesis protein